MASRVGPMARGCERGLCTADDFLWCDVLPRFPARAMKPSSNKPVAPPDQHTRRFTTLGGIPLKPVYTQQDLADANTNTSIGFPGEFPYTRGIYPTMYRGRLWTMRQYAGFGTAA